MDSGKKITIKILLSNGLTGSLIGSGGKAIKDLMTGTGARILVSSASDFYPGTSERVVLISGTVETVSLAQTMIWEMIALHANVASGEERSVSWDPSAMLSSLGRHDDVEVSCRLSVPASAAGLIIGRAGATVRQICEECGIKITMSNKDEALFTQERIISLSGLTGGCIKATDQIIRKLCEEDSHNFVFSGTSYSIPQNGNPLMAAQLFGNPYGMLSPALANAGGKPRVGGVGRGAGHVGSPAIPVASPTGPEQIIQLAVPNEIVGNLFGRGGSTLREIISLSGAKIHVSDKGDFIEGTTNRLVTITGTPACAQAAHLFINQRLQTPSKPPPSR